MISDLPDCADEAFEPDIRHRAVLFITGGNGMTTLSNRTLLEHLLVGGLDDWADIGWVMQGVRDFGLSKPDLIRTAAMGLVAEVLTRGFMTPGDVRNGSYVPWDTSPMSALECIIDAWVIEWPQSAPTPGAVVWLQNTEAGDQIARGVLEREAGIC